MWARVLFIFIVPFIFKTLVAFIKCLSERQLDNGVLWKVFGGCRLVNQVLKNLLFCIGYKEQCSYQGPLELAWPFFSVCGHMQEQEQPPISPQSANLRDGN